jgi:hypothetical protein
MQNMAHEERVCHRGNCIATQVTCNEGSSKSRCTWHTAGVMVIATHIGAQKGVKATTTHMAYSGDNSRCDARRCAAGKWQVATHVAYSGVIADRDAQEN